MAHRGFAHMGHHVVAFDVVAFEHVCNGRGSGALFVDKVAHAFAGCGAVTFKKSNAPAVRVVIGAAAALRKSGKTQRQAGRQMAVHSKELAHGGRPRVL